VHNNLVNESGVGWTFRAARNVCVDECFFFFLGFFWGFLKES
jgi:hypothetical protein